MNYLIWAVAFFGGAAACGWGIGSRSVGTLSRAWAWPLAITGAALMLAAFVYVAVDLA